MSLYLLLVSVVIIFCLVFNKISSRLGIPTLLAFILLGMAFGSDGIFKIPFDNYVFAEKICSVALIFIMFYGGFGTKWSEAKPVAVKAALLSSVGVVLTAGITGLFCYLVLKIELLESFLIGAVISSTDAASVFAVLRSKRLNLKNNTASLLEVESGSNDPFSYMLTAVILSVMSGTASAGAVLYMIFAQVVYGAAFGVLLAVISRKLLKNIRFSAAGSSAVFVLAVAIMAYAIPSALGGNGYLSVYIVGIVLGNSKIKDKKTLVHFFDGITGLMQMLLFFLLGLLAFPSRLPAVAFPALLIAVFLTFIARPIVVFGILGPLRSSLGQQALVSWAGLRGAASIVFAVMATISPAITSNDIFHMVFLIVLFSILVQGSLIPFAARKLKMIDENADVMKTFTDYSDEVPVQFIQAMVSEKHPWAWRALSDILLPPDTIVVLVERDGEKIVPNGTTVFKPGDVLILSARAPGRIDGVRILEKHVGRGDEWEGKAIKDIPTEHNILIIMIQRNGKIIIPQGQTVLKENDVLVINHSP